MGDIVSNKKTYLLSNALEITTDSEKENLMHWISIKNFDRSEKIEQVKAIFERIEVDKLTKLKIEEYYEKAEQCWSMIDVSSEKKSELLKVAQLLMNRKS